MDTVTLRIVGLIATALIGIFIFALAGSISSGFAGFYGGLPFWLIVLFVMSFAVYDYVEEAFGINDRVKFILIMTLIIACGLAFIYGAYGASTLFEVGKDVRVRSLGSSDDPFLVDGTWPKFFWYGAMVLFAAITLFVSRKVMKAHSAKS